MDHTPKYRSTQILFWEIHEGIHLEADIHVFDRFMRKPTLLPEQGVLPAQPGLHDLAEVNRSQGRDAVARGFRVYES